MQRQLVYYSFVIEVLYFIMSNSVIRESHVTVRHSALHETPHTYYDFNTAFSYYLGMCLSLGIQTAMVLLSAATIGHDYSNNLMYLFFLTIGKVLFDLGRLVAYPVSYKLSSV